MPVSTGKHKHFVFSCPAVLCTVFLIHGPHALQFFPSNHDDSEKKTEKINKKHVVTASICIRASFYRNKAKGASVQVLSFSTHTPAGRSTLYEQEQRSSCI